ncbi:MAG: hypothetical protein IIB90_15795, partial [Gemmatimonadetes bacterium]|nr:hypothetical protein [Gemmatimonadota bacterium]
LPVVPRLRAASARVTPRIGTSPATSMNILTDALNSDVTVDTEMGPAQLFEHYSEQLGDAGWVPRGTASSEDISIGRWDALDEDGEPVMGILGVWRSAVPGVHRAWIRMEREPRRR